LAERLGLINAAAAELGTTWPSLRKAFHRHGLGMPARNPEAVQQRAAPSAPTAATRTASSAASGARLTAPPAPTDPSNLTNGGWLLMPTDLTAPQSAINAD
jgi:hypothetical protein